MRLICPSCGAQYEVPAEVIPSEGRDVQCSACSNTWFQPHPDQDSALADEVDAPSVEPVAPPPDAPEAEPGSEAADAQSEPVSNEDAPAAAQSEAEDHEETAQEPAQRPLDEEVANVLREEAAYEAAARARDQQGGLESQPDLGLEPPAEDEAGRRTREARERMARMRGEAEPAAQAAASAGVAGAVAGSRRELLPDVEEINSTLRSSGERRPAAAADTDLQGTTPKVRSKRRRFRLGFYPIILLTLLALAVYIFAPQITQIVPQAKPYVTQYVEQIEALRGWLSSGVDTGLKWLDQMASENL